MDTRQCRNTRKVDNEIFLYICFVFIVCVYFSIYNFLGYKKVFLSYQDLMKQLQKVCNDSFTAYYHLLPSFQEFYLFISCINDKISNCVRLSELFIVSAVIFL